MIGEGLNERVALLFELLRILKELRSSLCISNGINRHINELVMYFHGTLVFP